MKLRHQLFCFLALSFGTFQLCFGQQPLQTRTVPLDMESIRWYDSYIKITYSRPHKNGREIFGDVVPFGEVWQTGANEATEIMLTEDILVNGDTLQAGAYTLLTIPGQDEWTIIFNSEVGQWQSHRYNSEFDALRTTIPATKTSATWEPLTIQFDKKSVSKTTLNILWDQTKVSVPIEFIEHR